MVGLLNVSNVSLPPINPFESSCSFITSTPRRDVTGPTFAECPNISGVSVRLPGSPPRIPQTPKPQTAVTKSTVEDSEFCVSDKNLRKISSARELLECWFHQINGPETPINKGTVLLKRRHSEFLRRRFTASLKADHRSLDKVPKSNLTKLSECAETPSPTGLNSPELSRHSFCRNCPARKARRSRVIRPRNVVLETTPGSSVKDKTSNHQHQGFGKASKYRKQYLQYPRALDFSEKPNNCKINVSFYGFFKKGALNAK